MNVMDFFWIFFMITAIQPIIRQKFLEASRKRLLSVIEEKRNSRVILLIHREETMSLIGFPVFRYIDINDSEEVLRAIQMTDPEVPIDLVLHTPGGLVLASLQIARALANHKAKVTVFVPHYAMSGGTLIALAADEIVMSPYATLGPVDPQLGQYAAVSIMKVIEQKPIEKVDDQTIILADQAQKAIAQVRQSVFELLENKMPKDKAARLSDTLTSGKWTHDYSITVKEAMDLGLNINDKIPKEILHLLQLYPQPVRRQPTVEYVPVPRKSKQHRHFTN